MTPGDHAGLSQGSEATSGAPAPQAAGPTLRSGDRAGAYRILQELGEGGFGSVFLAEQEEPVRRKVALKVIKWGMDTRQVIARFEAERQALALMDHPGIARVLDAGATESGRPFFVMEFVKGEPVTDYCDRNRLSIRERLELFIQVCQAVQHAHTKGIIHRDIKPSNILVSAHDGGHLAKVIDFGIAKATAGRLTEKTVFTEQQQLIGTPEYMSPEQAEGSLDIDTRTDVYSLGVLLYELLTGSTPFDRKTLRGAAYGEIQRIIREVEPVRPSTRLSGSTAPRAKGTPDAGGAPGGPPADDRGSAQSVARHRRSDARSLQRAIRTDLDWIALKALEKDRTRRYETASNLALDVQRHLNGEPVLAAPPSAAYRARKFVRRHRLGVLSGAAVVAALVLGMVTTSAAMLRAGANSRLAQAHAERARSESLAAVAAREEAEKVAGFMSDMLKGAGPLVAGGRDTTTLREMTDEAAARIERGELKGAPSAEVRLRCTIGEVYRQIGAYDRAQRMIGPALEMARALHPGDHEDVADALAKSGDLLGAQGDVPAAERLFREALAMRRRLHPGDHRELAAALNNLGVMLTEAFQVDAGEQLLLEALEMRRRLFPGDSADLAESLVSVGTLRVTRGDYAGAEPFYRDALEMWVRLYPGDHPRVALGHNNLAMALAIRGDVAGAEVHYRKSLEMVKRLFPNDHPQTVMGLHNLASLLHLRRGDLAGAEALYREAEQMCSRIFKGDHNLVAYNLNNLGTLLRDRGNAAEAEELFRRAAQMWKRLFPEGHPHIASATRNVADMLRARGDIAGAEPLYREALELRRRLLPADHTDIQMSVVELATLYDATSRPALAEPLWREMVALCERELPPGDPRLLVMRARLGVCLSKQGKWAESEPMLVEGFSALKAAPDAMDYIGKLCRAIVSHYESWDAAERAAGRPGKADELARWRAELDSLPPSAGSK